MAETDTPSNSGEGWRSDATMADLQRYVESDRFLPDITRGLEITRQLNKEERDSRNTNQDDDHSDES